MDEPVSGDRARLRVVANGLVKGVPGKQCIQWSAPGVGTIFGGIVGSKGYRARHMGMLAGKYAETAPSAEVYVAAGKPMTLVYLSTPDSHYQCSIGVTFVPAKDQDYEAVLAMDPTACMAEVHSLSHTSEKMEAMKAASCP